MGSDPVFAALDRWRAAAAPVENFTPSYDEVARRWAAIENDYPIYVNFYGRGARYYSEEELDRTLARFRWYWNDAEYTRVTDMTIDAEARLRRAKDARAAAEEACGYTSAERAMDELLSAQEAAGDALAATTPTTKEGALALAGFPAEVWTNREDMPAISVTAALDTLTAYIKATGGARA